MSRREAPERPLPWRLGDLLGLYATLAAGGIVILVGWWGASGTAEIASQVLWLNVALAGLIVAGTGIAVWLLTGRRAVGERLARLLPDLAAAAPQPDGAPAVRLVAAPRMTRYHRQDCPLAAGKDARPASADQHRRAGRRPCGVCRP